MTESLQHTMIHILKMFFESVLHESFQQSERTNSCLNFTRIFLITFKNLSNYISSPITMFFHRHSFATPLLKLHNAFSMYHYYEFTWELHTSLHWITNLKLLTNHSVNIILQSGYAGSSKNNNSEQKNMSLLYVVSFLECCLPEYNVVPSKLTNISQQRMQTSVTP